MNTLNELEQILYHQMDGDVAKKDQVFALAQRLAGVITPEQADAELAAVSPCEPLSDEKLQNMLRYIKELDLYEEVSKLRDAYQDALKALVDAYKQKCAACAEGEIHAAERALNANFVSAQEVLNG